MRRALAAHRRTVVCVAVIAAMMTVPERSIALEPVSERGPFDTVFTSVQRHRDVCSALGAGYEHRSALDPNHREVIGTKSRGTAIVAEHWGPRQGPQILLVARVHGDECTPALVVSALRSRPALGFGTWIIAELNPDGGAEHRRKNPDGVDLNRDGHALAAPETRALMELTARVTPILTIHIHSPNGWVGSHNGGIATVLGRDISRRTGMILSRAGRRHEPGLAFLWEGQERIIEDHPSLLIELPRMHRRETPRTPAKWTVTVDAGRAVRLASDIAASIRSVVAAHLGVPDATAILCHHCGVNNPR